MSSTIILTMNGRVWLSDHPPQALEVTEGGTVETNDQYVYTDNLTVWQLWQCMDASDQQNLKWTLINSTDLTN